MRRSEALDLLDCLDGLGICEKNNTIFEDGDIAYYFTLEDAICIQSYDLTDICTILEANEVSVITDEKADPKTHDMLCIYFKKV